MLADAIPTGRTEKGVRGACGGPAPRGWRRQAAPGGGRRGGGG